MAYEIVNEEEGSRTVRFQSPASQVDSTFRKVRREISKDLDMPGFRPGKVPRSIIDKRFGNVITSEVAERLSAELTEMVLREEDWILGDGQPSADGALPAEGEDYTFTVTYDIYETPEPTGYRELELVEPAFDVDREVEKSLESLRQRMVGFEAVDREAAEDDMVVLRADEDGGSEGGSAASEEEDGGDSDIRLRVGQQQAGPGFDALVKGLSAGDSFTARMVPSDPQADWKGDPHTFRVLEVREPVLPDLDDELAQKLGAENLEDLTGRIRSDLEERIEEDRRRFLEQQAVGELISTHGIEPPEYMVENLTRDFLGRLPDEEPDGETVERARKVAADKVREFLLLRAVADAEGIEVAEEEVEGERSPEEDAASVRDRLRNRKALELILESATITTREPEEPDGGEEAGQDAQAQPWTWELADGEEPSADEEGE
jgi:trigger factor